LAPGDQRLFAELYRRFRPFVGTVLAKRNVFSHDADDVLQSVFVEILESIQSSEATKRYDPRTAWKEHLAGVTCRESIKARQSVSRERAVGGTDHAGVIGRLPAALGGGDGPPDVDGAVSEIVAAVAADEPTRLAALLPHIEDMVRARLGKNEGRYPVFAALASGRIDTKEAIQQLEDLEGGNFNRMQVNMAVKRFRDFAREAASALGYHADPVVPGGP